MNDKFRILIVIHISPHKLYINENKLNTKYEFTAKWLRMSFGIDHFCQQRNVLKYGNSSEATFRKFQECNRVLAPKTSPVAGSGNTDVLNKTLFLAKYVRKLSLDHRSNDF